MKRTTRTALFVAVAAVLLVALALPASAARDRDRDRDRDRRSRTPERATQHQPERGQWSQQRGDQHERGQWSQRGHHTRHQQWTPPRRPRKLAPQWNYGYYPGYSGSCDYRDGRRGDRRGFVIRGGHQRGNVGGYYYHRGW